MPGHDHPLSYSQPARGGVAVKLKSQTRSIKLDSSPWKYRKLLCVAMNPAQIMNIVKIAH